MQDLKLPGGVDDKRFTSRRTMLDAVNDHFAAKEKADGLEAMDTFYQRAYSLISSEKAREAFNINAEPPALRDEYGRNAAGQRMLMARRLVTAGVRFVSLTYGGWDMHAGIKGGMQDQLPVFDQAFAALIRDLDRSGLLDSTLVMVSSRSSAGRRRSTPRPAATTGPRCSAWSWPAAASRRASSTARPTPPPPSRRTTADGRGPGHDGLPRSWASTPTKKLMAPGNRPIDIVREGQVRKELLA